MSADMVAQRVKDFLRWNVERFEALDQKAPIVPPDLWGWRRGSGDEGEWWVSPKVWLETLFDGDEAEAQHAARTLRDLDLLRTQDSRNLQVVANVRGKPTRVYAVRSKIATWRPLTARDYGGYDKAGALLCQGQRGAVPAPALSSDPSDLSAMLERGVALALQKGMEVLSMSLDPSDRQSAALLRSQTAFAGHLINAQVRVDETRMRQKRANAVERLSRMLEEEQARQRELGY